MGGYVLGEIMPELLGLILFCLRAVFVGMSPSTFGAFMQAVALFSKFASSGGVEINTDYCVLLDEPGLAADLDAFEDLGLTVYTNCLSVTAPCSAACALLASVL